MKKSILVLMILLIFIYCKGQSIFPKDSICDTIHINTANYEGIIFGKNCLKKWILKENRWNPTKEDIEIAEILIKKYIIKQVKKKGMPNQVDSPKIHLNFDKYLRQYVGYVNEKGDRIIMINCFWKDFVMKYYFDWEVRWIDVMDGGSYYWQVEVNIGKKKCFDYNVNG